MANEIEKTSAASTQALIQDLRQIINQAHGHVAATANYVLTMMYWRIGERINRETLGNQRAEYGKQIVAQVAQQLQVDFDTKGFEEKNIRRMMQFAQTFPDVQIVAPLARQLGGHRGSQSPFRRHRRQQLPGSAIRGMIQDNETTEFI